MSDPKNVVSRYTTAARINHWITAASLILLALSGLALFHPSLFFLTNLFGGGQMTRAIHPWIGVVLAVSFTGLFIRFFSLNFWTREDTVWMKNLGASELQMRAVLFDFTSGDTRWTSSIPHVLAGGSTV